jgi:hypothetical protein
MKDHRLFIFVEGNDDERFFSRIIRPLFISEYSSVEMILYASMKSVKVCRFIKGISAMHDDFILVADIDQEPNARAKKKAIMAKFCNIDEIHIMVIIQEIESWYLAGLDDHASRALGIRPLQHTDFLTKEHFNRVIPRHYPSRIAFMVECLNEYSLPVAMEKNRSFRYFISHYTSDAREAARIHPHGEILKQEKKGGTASFIPASNRDQRYHGED